MSSVEIKDREYLFEWDLLLQAVFKPIEGGEPIKACFSKVYLEDSELWIDAKVGELTMDSKPKVHSPGSHKSTPTKTSKMDDFCFDDPDHDTSEEEAIDPDADAMLAMGLPVCFDQTPLNNKKSGASKKKLFNVDNYWTRFGKLFTSGVEELSKLTQGDAIENTLFYTALKAAVSRATKLVKNHTKVEYFYDLLKAGKLEPTEEDVMRLIKSDVAKFNTICTSNDAVNFVKKLRQLHYVSGFQLKKNDNDKVCKPESAVEILKDYESVKFRTFPPLIPKKIVNYNLMDCEDLDAPEVEESKSGIVKTDEGDPKNFDFSFDPVRDAHLVARDALKFFGKNSSIKKYWHQRFRLMSKLNDGILFDEESWFSVTPEQIARHIADRFSNYKNGLILDCFTGAGGNAIHFALRGIYVYAIDLDPLKIRIAKQNAKIYGVEDKIQFFCGNAFHIMDSFIKSKNGKKIFDAIFLSPPWGGPEYSKEKEFKLEMCTPNGYDIFLKSLKLTENIAYFLPKNTRSSDLIALARETKSKKVEVENNELNGKIKSLTAYFGQLTAI